MKRILHIIPSILEKLTMSLSIKSLYRIKLLSFLHSKKCLSLLVETIVLMLPYLKELRQSNFKALGKFYYLIVFQNIHIMSIFSPMPIYPYSLKTSININNLIMTNAQMTLCKWPNYNIKTVNVFASKRILLVKPIKEVLSKIKKNIKKTQNNHLKSE